jgi:hypothetical protein
MANLQIRYPSKYLLIQNQKMSPYLFRYREVSQQTNYRYLEALAVVDDPTPALQQLNDITARKNTASGRGVRLFNPLSTEDIQLFKEMMAGGASYPRAIQCRSTHVSPRLDAFVELS